ncbi:M20 family peptidase [Adhaeribacter soli]|uniref:M20/M25/M40 family metallo-hydrolase n=1 Tax=Adhaeribacter soli TaxID=2607655 RepID=A0A5N1J488_9BACT|nr:M20 family peptidase [Adhaeribacter soli]KAA9340674.1 M20/M25/M40 family metallo-hydrolase [Adhaeribacter soli]
MKKLLLSLLVFLLLFIAFLVIRTVTFRSRQLQVAALPKVPVSDSAKFHLAEAIRIRTISPEDPAAFDSTAFYRFREFLRKTYPLSEQRLQPKTINKFSLLYKWEGSDAGLKPVILMGHLDVVPVAEESLKDWKAAPFGGEIKDGYIWGRGAIDDKMSVIGILEATEKLLEQGFQPKRTLYLAFGHDEEIGGRNGAQAIVKHLQTENVKAEFVLDEGYAITQKLVPGLDTDVALIGIAEKGFASLELTATVEGGHSSMPKNETAIDVISQALVTLRKHPFKPTITPPVQEFIKTLGPEMPAFQKFAFANAWLLEPLILKTYQKTPSGNALVSTTMAPTIFRSGLKENVIPAEATAVINFRLLPGTRINSIVSEVKRVIKDDRIRIKLKPFSSEPSPVSGIETAGYNLLTQTIKQTFPNTLTSPSLVLAATDSRFYYALSPNVYRFLPYKINKENINAFHGVNERIAVEEFEDAVRFYERLVRNVD